MKNKVSDDKKMKRAELTQSVIDSILVNLKIVDTRAKTFLYVVAVDKRLEKNRQVSLACQSAMPINGYVYDAKNDYLLVNCADSLNLGVIESSFKMTFDGVGGWQREIPIPAEAIMKLLSSSQFRAVKEFKDRYGNGSYDIHFIQMVGCN